MKELKVAHVFDPRTGAVSAIKINSWTPIQRDIFEAAAVKEGLTITYTVTKR